MLRVLSVFGTRPEAVKMAPVVHALARQQGVQAGVCVTAQHRAMLDQVLDLFEIVPDFDLDVMRADQTLAEVSVRILQELEPVLVQFKPDWVLVQGDTTTAAITALLAYYHRLRVGHVEAGLRTHDKWQPFPEEINRKVVGVSADLHFAPTEWARRNLLAEGVPPESVLVTGNPVIDALNVVASQPPPPEVCALIERLGVGAGRRLLLVTAHRRENFGAPLESVCAALRDLAARGDVEIVWPVHPNPNVYAPVHDLLGQTAHVTLLPHADYLPMVHLIKSASLILTDSGGIQEEAPAFGIPVLVLRQVTERPEGVAAGVTLLTGTDRAVILREASHLLDDAEAYARMARAVNPFGDGQAAGRIVDALLHFKAD
jgi:UDP-N-acetylglucosamine 2-epimerase (non-hydrolysing)